jgi:SPX domain protein involved in polyphosphate accumulation
LATLRIALDGITSKRRNSYRSHHTSSETTDLATLRDIYVELAALRSYCDLNQTGFYKIIKKYDKTMEVWIEIGLPVLRKLIY